MNTYKQPSQGCIKKINKVLKDTTAKDAIARQQLWTEIPEKSQAKISGGRMSGSYFDYVCGATNQM